MLSCAQPLREDILRLATFWSDPFPLSSDIPAASAAAQQRRRHWTGKNGFRPCAVSDAGSVNSMTQGSILAVCGSMEFALDF